MLILLLKMFFILCLFVSVGIYVREQNFFSSVLFVGVDFSFSWSMFWASDFAWLIKLFIIFGGKEFLCNIVVIFVMLFLWKCLLLSFNAVLIIFLAVFRQQLLCSAANPPQLYGLPKIHKDGIPLRPILSSFQVPCYQLSKYVGHILKNIISDQYNVRNSDDFKDRIGRLNIKNDEMMVSFDVVSLFTNIPVVRLCNSVEKFSTALFQSMEKKCLCMLQNSPVEKIVLN